MKKYTSILLLVLVLMACATTKNGNTKNMKLLKATKQGYVLGKDMQNGKSAGVVYSMYFGSNGGIKVEKVWIDGKNIDFDQVATDANGAFRVRSTFYTIFKGNVREKVKAPIEYEGEGLIQYKENDEVKYFVVKSFKRFESTQGK